jgi:hypothetical protein
MLENTDIRNNGFIFHMACGAGAKKGFLKGKEVSDFIKHFSRYYIVDTTTYQNFEEILERLYEIKDDLHFPRISTIGCFLLSENRYVFFTSDGRFEDRISFNKNRGVSP